MPVLAVLFPAVAKRGLRNIYELCLALQLLLLEMSESMGNHDSEIVDAGRVD